MTSRARSTSTLRPRRCGPRSPGSTRLELHECTLPVRLLRHYYMLTAENGIKALIVGLKGYVEKRADG